MKRPLLALGVVGLLGPAIPCAIGRVAAQPAPAPVTPAAPAKDPKLAPATMTVAEAQESIASAMQYFQRTQGADGSWGTSTVESLWEENYSNASFYAWKMAGTAIACLAMLEVDETPEIRACLDKALRWLVDSAIPLRCSDWDIDNNWNTLYAFQTLVRAAQDPRYQDAAWSDKIKSRGLELYKMLEKYQDPLGGWGYYEGIVVSRRPTWSTSFSTACVIPALLDAKQQLGWEIDSKVFERATKYVERCRLPSGAYTYDLSSIPFVTGGEDISHLKASLGRTQVCNWALRKAGSAVVTDDRIRAGLEAFFGQHKFLDVARMKPVPHESYYRNAGYFYFFGHCYAGRLINELPAAERESWHARLRPHLIKAQWKDGSSIDFVGSTYSWLYATGFSVLALDAGLPDKTPTP
ncbi:MAG: hypothetical protein ACKVX7_15045 [Planctomycetota bacterium]